MARPLQVTFVALGVYLFSAMALVGGLFAFVSPGNNGDRHWFLSIALAATGFLGNRAGHHIMAQQSDAGRATVAFTAAGLLIPLAMYQTVDLDRRHHFLLPGALGLAVFLVFGFLAARLVKRTSSGAA